MGVRQIHVCTPNRSGVAACAFGVIHSRLFFSTPDVFEVARFMSRKIYVGNLPWSTTSADLEAMFAEHGAVAQLKLFQIVRLVGHAVLVLLKWNLMRVCRLLLMLLTDTR